MRTFNLLYLPYQMPEQSIVNNKFLLVTNNVPFPEMYVLIHTKDVPIGYWVTRDWTLVVDGANVTPNERAEVDCYVTDITE